MALVGVEKLYPNMVAVHGGANRAVPAPVLVPPSSGVPFLYSFSLWKSQGMVWDIPG